MRNLPPALALMEAGHVEEAGLRDADDEKIWTYAIQHGAVVVTKDEDFPDRCLRSNTIPVVVWLRIGNCRNVELLRWLMPLLAEIVERIHLGERLIEVK